MSPLAFDKQGKPFTFLRRTKKLLVRLFRNPSARGTCCQVLGPDGQALYIDPEIDCLEFRRAVGYIPGLYRLDQCDEDGNELDDAPPAYVSIDTARNASISDGTNGLGEVSPLVIIQQMAAVQADVMKTMAAQQGAVLAAAAEILRAPYRPAPAAAPATDLRNTQQDTTADDEYVDESEDDETAPEHPATAFLRMMQPYFPDIGATLWEKCANLMSGRKAGSSSTPKQPPAPVPPRSQAPPMEVSQDSNVASGAAVDEGERVVPAPHADGVLEPASNAQEAVSTNATDTIPIAPPMPTPEQFFHLQAIREQLTPTERKLAEHVIARMDAQTLTHWLGKLASMSVGDATLVIRKLAAESQSAGS